MSQAATWGVARSAAEGVSTPEAWATRCDESLDALLTQHADAQRPDYAVAGTPWVDNSGTPWILYLYDGTEDIELARYDAAEHSMQWAQHKGSDLASATELTPGQNGNVFSVTGTTQIEGIATLRIGSILYLRFAAALTLKHNAATFRLPQGGNIRTAAGDWAIFHEADTGKWECVSYSQSPNIHYVALVADHTITAADRGRFFDCQAELTLTLPDSVDVGDGFYFHMRASGGLVTVVRSGTDTLNGGTQIYFAQTESATINSDGAGGYHTVIRAGHIVKRMQLLTSGTTYTTSSTSDVNLSDILTYTPRSPASSSYMVSVTANCIAKHASGGDDTIGYVRLTTYDAGGSGTYNILLTQRLGHTNVQASGTGTGQNQLHLTLPFAATFGTGQIDSNNDIRLRLRGYVGTSSRELVQYSFRAVITEYQNA